MRRREFIAFLGGAAAWPLAARAQQEVMPVVGVLSARSAMDSAGSIAALRAGLEETGYLEGRNVTFEYRWADFHYDRLPALAADLTRRPLAVIVVMGGEPAALAATAATQTIPIVFNSGGDPVRAGLVASLNRPGGNATGVSMLFLELGRKQLEMLQELVPKAAVIAQLVNPTLPPAFTEKQINDARAAGHVLGKEIYVVTAISEGEISSAFGDLVEHRAGALMVAPAFIFRPPGATSCLGSASRHSCDLFLARFRGCRRSDELWSQPRRCLSPDRRLRRSHSERRESSRPPGGATHRFRADN
jgi:putative ABC transport system substrate-binding protein